MIVPANCVFFFFSRLRVDLFLVLTTRRELFSLQSVVFLAWFFSWFFYPSVEYFVWIVLTSSLFNFIWACYGVSWLHLGLALQNPNKTSQSAKALPSTCSISTEMPATKVKSGTFACFQKQFKIKTMKQNALLPLLFHFLCFYGLA